MQRVIRLSALTCAISAAIALSAANAGAATTDPATLGFGHQAVGTTSPTKSTTLTTSCLSLTVTCLSLPSDTMNVSVATTGNFIATTNCPASLAPSLLGQPASCTINVAFRPLGAGSRSGTLSTGTVGLVAPTAGPTVALSGTGAAAASSSSGSGAATKCKKKKKGHRHAAQSAKKKQKKCKNKKKKHHHRAIG